MNRQARIMLAVACLWVGGLAGGCNEAQRQRIDRYAGSAQTVGQVVADVAQGPAGDVLPDDSRFWVSLGGLAVAAVAGIWQSLRRATAVKTLTAVVKAVDKATPEARDAVKAGVVANAAESALIAQVKQA